MEKFYLRCWRWGVPEILETEIPVEDIAEFGIVNLRNYTKKNTFKGFRKYYYLVNVDGVKLYFGKNYFDELKQLLKGKYVATHCTEVAYKGFKEVKATDWYYRIDREEIINED